jgi:hypothetical protein
MLPLAGIGQLLESTDRQTKPEGVPGFEGVPDAVTSVIVRRSSKSD